MGVAEAPLDSRESKLAEAPGDEETVPSCDEKSLEEQPPVIKLYPEQDLDRGIVGWEGQDDPKNPQNFRPAHKWGLLMVMSAITFISPLASSMFAPAVSYVQQDLDVENETLLSFSVSIYLLGYTVGDPLALGSECLSNAWLYSSVLCYWPHSAKFTVVALSSAAPIGFW